MKDQLIWLSNINYDENEDIIKQLRIKTQQYGDFSFDDDKWYCNYKHKDNRNRAFHTIYFDKVSSKYKFLLKCYSLLKEEQLRLLIQMSNESTIF